MTHLHMRTVMMLAIITVWMMWHVATSSPACSLTFCALASAVVVVGGLWWWWVVAVDDGDGVHLVVSVCECVVCVDVARRQVCSRSAAEVAWPRCCCRGWWS